ncbi:ribonuclease H [Spirochaetia bacterium]|nr:ribonuclease H [Spirochaetia bacterium]
MSPMNISIYTDGGCSGNPGPGGWAYVYVVDKAGQPEILSEKSGAEAFTTNNRMELMAVISGLEGLSAPDAPDIGYAAAVTVYTDSQYVQKGISVWIKTWKKNEWRNSSKEPVKNRDLWEKLDELAGRFPVIWKWVKGHAGDVFNEHCDFMTQRAIASLKI